MRNIMNRIFNTFLNFKRLLKYLLQRPSWSSNVRVIEWYKIFIASIWVLYLALEIEQFKRFASPIYKFVSNYDCLKNIILFLYENRVIILLVLTIPTILDIIFKKVSYKKLDPELFPEYDLDDYPFQTHLVEFLNSPDPIHNVYWLDGSWGSGKTFFIKTFFENQIYKKKEIYYISCFGIKTREQAEKILINEIEKQSILGNLDFIPLVGGVFKGFFKIVGTDLMKRDSIIIFDDFERVSYAETSDKPSDYNDLLGYIDYLSENKRFKIIVILNSEEIKSTKKNLIDNKFKLNQNRMLSTEEVIDSILRKSKLKDSNLGQILALIYKIYYVDRDERAIQIKNKDSKVKKPSLRAFQKDIEDLSYLSDSEAIRKYIIDCMNGGKENESIIKSLFKYFEDTPFLSNSYLYFESVGFREGTELISKKRYINNNNYLQFASKKISYFYDLLSCLWLEGKRDKEFRYLGISSDSTYSIIKNYSPGEIEEILVNIYYDILEGNEKKDYHIDDIDELRHNEEYQNFLNHCLSIEFNVQSTINGISLERLVQNDSEGIGFFI